MEPGLYSVHRYPRRTRSARRDWLILSLFLGCLAMTALASRLSVGVGAGVRTASAAHLQARHPAKPAAKVKTAAAVSAVTLPPLAAAPFSWDYRWISVHPGAGPLLHARSAILVDVDSRRVLAMRQPHLRTPMASTTKLMTAMVALDNAQPWTVITMPPIVAQMPPTIMGLSPGETLSVKDTMFGMLLWSGNDAAEAFAAGIIPRDQFIQQMNAKAAQMGLTDTHFVNPTGIDDPDHYSSPHDLAIMAAYAYAHYPLIAQVVGTKDYVISATSHNKAFFPENFNRLLWSYPGAIGFKTGQTDAAGFCVVSGATRGRHTLVAVVLDDNLSFTDSTALLNYGFTQVK